MINPLISSNKLQKTQQKNRNDMIPINKKNFQKLEIALINAEMDLAELKAKGQPKYTTEQVETMLEKVIIQKAKS